MFDAIKLPYKSDIFEPLISQKTFEFHYGKHYKTYLENLNNFIKDSMFEGLDLETVIEQSYGNPEYVAIFNNAAQAYNHEFYFRNLQPLSETLKARIKTDFDTMDNFKAEWKKASLGQFGSGWVWLVEKDGKLEILKTSNADTPVAKGMQPLLCIDVWEHAYYLDYQNKRGDYVDAFLKIVL